MKVEFVKLKTEVSGRSFIKRQLTGTSSDKEWQRMVIEWQQVTTSGTKSESEWKRVTTSDNEWYNKWQRVTASSTTSDNEWYNEQQQVTTNDNERQWITTSDTTNESK